MTAEHSNVIPIAKPKKETHRYRRHDITVTYLPQEQTPEKRFKWSFSHTRTLSFSGRGASAALALVAAKHEVDSVVQHEGGAA